MKIVYTPASAPQQLLLDGGMPSATPYTAREQCQTLQHPITCPSKQSYGWHSEQAFLCCSIAMASQQTASMPARLRVLVNEHERVGHVVVPQVHDAAAHPGANRCLAAAEDPMDGTGYPRRRLHTVQSLHS
jgi:hypothetical protein